jgi:hypothetical protein
MVKGSAFRFSHRVSFIFLRQLYCKENPLFAQLPKDDIPENSVMVYQGCEAIRRPLTWRSPNSFFLIGFGGMVILPTFSEARFD